MKHYEYCVVRTFSDGSKGLMASKWNKAQAIAAMEQLGPCEGAKDEIVVHVYDEQEYRYLRAVNG